MITYAFLQAYWWFLVALLGGLLVFLLFVQGANSLIFALGGNEEERRLIVNSTGRKWEFTFTTLVTFGGAFFASFPLFYSTSFGGAYWLWMLILVSFVLQAVAYEFQSKPGNVLGRTVYRRFLVVNGIVGPFLLGAAVATFFTGSAFVVGKSAMADVAAPVISRWANAWHGLDALANPWVWLLGLAVVFLARTLGSLYLINNVDDAALAPRIRRQVLTDAVPFVVLFVAFVVYVLIAFLWIFAACSGLFTFGGGYAMISLIEAEVIKRRGWLPQSEFLDLLTLAQSSPGPIAINTSVFIGYKVRGLRGAATAAFGAVLPSFLIILIVAIFFAGIRHNVIVDAAFKGMRPAVVALIAVPVLSLARGMHPALWVVVVLVALAVWGLGWSPVLLIIAGAVAGIAWTLTIGKKARS